MAWDREFPAGGRRQTPVSSVAGTSMPGDASRRSCRDHRFPCSRRERARAKPMKREPEGDRIRLWISPAESRSPRESRKLLDEFGANLLIELLIERPVTGDRVHHVIPSRLEILR